jgi:hypothetical protein
MSAGSLPAVGRIALRRHKRRSCSKSLPEDGRLRGGWPSESEVGWGLRAPIARRNKDPTPEGDRRRGGESAAQAQIVFLRQLAIAGPAETPNSEALASCRGGTLASKARARRRATATGRPENRNTKRVQAVPQRAIGAVAATCSKAIIKMRGRCCSPRIR